MTIIEALKSGKKIKRKEWTRFESDPTSHITKHDILADDWELEQTQVTITRDKFFEAYAQAVCDLKPNQTTSVLMDLIAARLGL